MRIIWYIGAISFFIISIVILTFVFEKYSEGKNGTTYPKDSSKYRFIKRVINNIITAVIVYYLIVFMIWFLYRA